MYPVAFLSTCNLKPGLVVPIPTLPEEVTVIILVSLEEANCNTLVEDDVEPALIKRPCPSAFVLYILEINPVVSTSTEKG
jgi:hypothetical protein